MFRFRPDFVLLAAVLLLCGGLASPVTAQDATPVAGEVTILAPDEEYAGATLGEWNARWFQWAFGNPNTDPSGDRCSYGQAGPVFFLPVNFGPTGSTVTCVVPEGVALFFNLGGANCSTVEPPPYFGRDEDELRACAAAATDADATSIPVAAFTVTINGQEVPNLASYRSSTPLAPIILSEDNVFGAPAGVALFVNDAYSLLIAPPPVGTYEIVLTQGADLITYEVSVEAAQIIEPEATPEAATPAA